MAETKNAASQVQQLPGMDQWKKAVDEQANRSGELYEELGKAHAKWIEYGNTQLDELTELMKTQFNYANELMTGWRKLSLDATKKSFEYLAR